ncbi:hypothetical protein L7F22_009941 [Adiantum nelumboides]|nr:hypothetical protein [Adiantum nelumboides]
MPPNKKRGDDDHRIDLIQGSSPPNKPLYRVSHAQQEEIMSQVNELVQKGMDFLIQLATWPSLASYSEQRDHKIPGLGLGVWHAELELLHSLILEAIHLGYHHFDCAADYKSEKEVGQALAEFFRQGLVKRSNLFITTKLWNSNHGHVREACEDNFKKLQLDYLDFYLVHFPVATRHTSVGSTSSALDGDEVLDIDVIFSKLLGMQ